MEKTYRNVRREGDHVEGQFSYNGESWIRFSADWTLARIDRALENSEAFRRIWAEQDGYGEPGYTPVQGYDWSGIRDASPESVERMDAIAKEYVSDALMTEMYGLNGS